MFKDNENLIPGEEDENIGGEPPKKKKEKKRKSKEERVADRKIVFWMMIILVLITIVFYIYPIIKEQRWSDLNFNKKTSGNVEKTNTNSPWKSYTEINF